jgi:excisionase family DNA binding protein
MGVSESSLKRWVDEGRIRAAKTAGGHRRIPIVEAVRFVRETGASIEDPAILGLADVEAAALDHSARDDDAERLFTFLQEGRSREARGTVLAWYLTGRSITDICDGPLRASMSRLGELWQHSPEGIFIEHRATDICIQAMNQLRSLLLPPADAPVALGGAPQLDPYILPSLVAAAVLEAEGFRAVNLGANTPAAAMLEAVRHHNPILVWLSATSSKLDGGAADQTADLAKELHLLGAQLVVGGQMRHVFSPALPSHTYLASTMSELAAFARGALAARPAQPQTASN